MSDTPASQKGFLLGRFSDTKPVISAAVREFLAGDAEQREKTLQETINQRQDEIKLADGALTREQVSRPINNSAVLQAARAEQERKAKGDDDFYFHVLLVQMRERIEELERRMAENFEALEEKYGEDVIGGMAATFLSEDKLAELHTDEQRMEALAEHFLDENGEIRDEYKDLEEAQYVRDWHELQTLKPVVAKFDGRNDLTVEEKAEILRAADTASLADNKNKIALSGNDTYQDTVDQQVDSDRSNLSGSKSNSTLTFG